MMACCRYATNFSVIATIQDLILLNIRRCANIGDLANLIRGGVK
jgi:hypothetical protein